MRNAPGCMWGDSALLSFWGSTAKSLCMLLWKEREAARPKPFPASIFLVEEPLYGSVIRTAIVSVAPDTADKLDTEMFSVPELGKITCVSHVWGMAHVCATWPCIGV